MEQYNKITSFVRFFICLIFCLGSTLIALPNVLNADVSAIEGSSDAGSIDVSDVYIYDYEGYVEVLREGKKIKLKKKLHLNPTDQINIYYYSNLELYFGKKRNMILRINGEKNFVLNQLSKEQPLAFDVQYDPKKKQTRTVMIFKPEPFYLEYADLLKKGDILHTAVFVEEGKVGAQNVYLKGTGGGKEQIVSRGQMTYVFRDKEAFPPLPWEQGVEFCLEDCWEEECWGADCWKKRGEDVSDER